MKMLPHSLSHLHSKPLRRRNVRSPFGGAGLGFTLIELMIVVAIVAILAAIALPAYSRYVVKTRRAAATACLSEYANYMERYYTTNLRYDQDASAAANAIPTLDCSTPQQTGNNYQYTTTVLAANAFTFQAKPINSQATGDTQCATLTIDQKGTRTDSGPASLSECW